MSAPAAPPSRSIALQFLAAGLVWGASFLFMKVALTGVSPGQVAWTRVLLGAGTLGSVAGEVAILGATASYGFSFAYMRRFASETGMSAVAFTFGYIGMAGVIMLLLTPVLVLTPVRLDLGVVGSLATLGCLGTGVAYIWSQNTVRAWGPTAASTVTYLTPVVGVTLGVVLLGEPVTWNEPAGAAVVFVGILLAQDRLRRRRAVSAPAAILER